MTVYFLAPEDNHPWGGIRRIYMFVDILNEGNIPAAVLRGSPDFRCTWFENETVIQSAEGLTLDARRDLLVIPEVYGPRIVSLAPGIRRIMLTQNPYEFFMNFSERADISFWRELQTIDRALVVSDDSAALLAQVLPKLPVQKLVLGIDQSLYHPEIKSSRTIVFMPRKRHAEAKVVMGILHARGLLDDWEVVEIDGVSEQEAAAALRRATIFISFNHLEGFGLPAAEAMACGCIVVGFDGRGGREFFRSDFGFPVDDGDVVGMAHAMEEVLRQYEDDPTPLLSVAAAASRHIAATYSFERQRESVIGAFSDALDNRDVPPAVVTLTNRDVSYQQPLSQRRRLVRLLSQFKSLVSKADR
jgi:glycosyltransferase involved in cell wall biosynthesis